MGFSAVTNHTMRVLAFSIFVASAAAFKEVRKLEVREGNVQDPSFENSLGSSEKFAEWKSSFGKAYDTVEAEAAAFDAWLANEEIIMSHNAKGLTFSLGHNEYSDLTNEQFIERMGLNQARPAMGKADRVHKFDGNTTVPDSVDWVAKGAVTSIKNQERCGSCWAFSTTGSTEGAYAIASQKLTSLSEQMLVSCDKVDSGCNGGLMDNAFGWIKKNGGICTESSYPYTSGAGKTGTCKSSCSPAVTITGHTDVEKGDEDALKQAVAQQPVSIAIEADKSAFQLYKSGILKSSGCGKKLDHGVLIVGYGKDDGTKYWKVKNSWGKTWGEEGYVRMIMGNDECGLADGPPSYPTGAKAVGPGPGPSPGPSPSDTHYEDPNDGGCQSDEVDIQIQGVSGSVCAPKCGLFKPCPTDLPDGVTATPQCALQDSSSGKKYCALLCSPSLPILDQQAADDQCGEKASCKAIQTVGICTYDS